MSRTLIDGGIENGPQPADTSIARSGETLRQGEWRDELLRSGIRGKAGQHMKADRRGLWALPVNRGRDDRPCMNGGC